MNNLLNGMKNETNYTYTENGALTHQSTLDGLLDLFMVLLVVVGKQTTQRLHTLVSTKVIKEFADIVLEKDDEGYDSNRYQLVHNRTK